VAEESVADDNRSGTIPSPCIGICELDGQSRLCRGCLRSGDEIAAWRDASDHERRQILKRVRKRREEAGALRMRRESLSLPIRVSPDL
jgi:uncharacterized protein